MAMKLFLLVVLMLVIEKTWADCSGVDFNNDTAIETSANLTVDCQESSVIVTINICVFKRMGYDEADFSIVGDSSVIGYSFPPCSDASFSASYSAATEIITFEITPNFTACGTTVSTVDPDDIVYTNAVRTIGFTGSSSIARRKNVLFEYSCTYKRYYNISDLLGFTPQVVAVEREPLLETGDFNPTVKLCGNETCGWYYADGAVVDVLSMVYLVFTTEKDLHIQIIKVYATDTADPAMAANIYHLVERGCKVDPTAILVNNGVSISYICFWFFHWTLDESLDVYFHVVYGLCDSDEQICSDPCIKRRRRAARMEFEDENLLSKTIGPFKTRVK